MVNQMSFIHVITKIDCDLMQMEIDCVDNDIGSNAGAAVEFFGKASFTYCMPVTRQC